MEVLFPSVGVNHFERSIYALIFVTTHLKLCTNTSRKDSKDSTRPRSSWSNSTVHHCNTPCRRRTS